MPIKLRFLGLADGATSLVEIIIIIIIIIITLQLLIPDCVICDSESLI